ncbi:hypothetical protein Scep_001916 [Stephania cephalantha]|uniref:Uncharacterized protein n=1 Tax=Stephania cephalantha TaxID=152367 RepID=A0AAP0LBQ9_9MAGN
MVRERLSHLAATNNGEQWRELQRQRRQKLKADGDGFKGIDEQRRGLHRQRRQRRRQTVMASEAATTDGTTSGRRDDNSQLRQRAQPPADGADLRVWETYFGERDRELTVSESVERKRDKELTVSDGEWIGGSG